MSRVGNKIITIPEGVNVTIENGKLLASGSRGSLEFKTPSGISVVIKDNQIKVNRAGNSKITRSLHGTSSRIIGNIVRGLSAGFSKKLDFKGVGFTVVVSDNKLSMRLGFSHPVEVEIPEGLEVKVVKNTIIVEGIDKEAVGALAAKIRDTKKPEVYKGKGIKYHGEVIRKKAGKAVQTSAS